MARKNGSQPIDGNKMVIIGEGSARSTTISVQELQNIYYELTGKTENITKTYKDSSKIFFRDLTQLHLRISQSLEQFNVVATNSNVKVYYLSNTQEAFSSFDRFANFNSGSSSVVASIVIEYNLLIILPKLEKPQNYTLAINLSSRTASESAMGTTFSSGIERVIFRIHDSPVSIRISYVDYIVARTFVTVVDEWFASVEKTKRSRVVKFFQSKSHYIPVISR